MDPRLRRLAADYDQMRAAFAAHERIRVLATEGNPPEKYVTEFNLIGLLADEQGALRQSNLHRAEVFLPLDYPRRAPFCRMLTPVFHPNIDPQKICIGDHWSAGQRLVDLIVRIGEMITYQSYNVKSPLNAEAARWAELNLDRLPLERIDLTVGP
ncbi:MAG TPA: ubiquitin-conjugating enzyme E2 [Roseiflexaceae bacterium]|jgi:ubiquitin-protein ligase